MKIFRVTCEDVNGVLKDFGLELFGDKIFSMKDGSFQSTLTVDKTLFLTNPDHVKKACEHPHMKQVN